MPSPESPSTTRRPSCRQDGCPIAASGEGRCLEGFSDPAEECPHFTWADNKAAGEASTETSDEASVPEAEPPAAPTVPLPSGDAMLASETRAVTHAHAPTVVAILGPPKSGKTTLIAGLWDGFASGPVGGYAFAGSDTQPGLERIAFPARVGSGNARPTTNRTPRGRDVRYLHLAVRDRQRRGPTRHLLLSDIPGEFVKDAAESAEGFGPLGLLRFADRVLLLIDGGALVDPARRQQAIARTRSLLGNGLDSGAIPLSARLDAAVTKWDLVEAAAPSDPLVMQSVEKVGDLLDRRLENRVHPYTLYRVAARPIAESDLEPRYGLPGLLDTWVHTPPRAARPPYQPLPQSGDRESTRFLWRHLATSG